MKFVLAILVAVSLSSIAVAGECSGGSCQSVRVRRAFVPRTTIVEESVTVPAKTYTARRIYRTRRLWLFPNLRARWVK